MTLHPEDDASTEIERELRRFCTDVTSRFAAAMREKKVPSAPRVQLDIAREAESTRARTPRQQAALISKNWSWVCWSAHMSDKARHVEVRVDGTRTWDPRKALGPHFPTFASIWTEAMHSHRLLNFNARPGWSDKDWHHLELHAARITRSDARAQACLAEYVRMTRAENRPRNEQFEQRYGKELAPHIQRLGQPLHAPSPPPKPSPAATPTPARPRQHSGPSQTLS